MTRLPSELADLRPEAAVYEHLSGEQGVFVPHFVAGGRILDSSFYSNTTELLGH